MIEQQVVDIRGRFTGMCYNPEFVCSFMYFWFIVNIKENDV